MESPITLSAETEEALNQLIDEKLKQGYLIKGGMHTDDEGKLNQIMVQATNIDKEMTLKSAVKLIVGLTLYASIIYFLF